jgi:phosphoenolpyruvate carboxykinase (ATP)
MSLTKKILTTADLPIVTMGRNELSGHCLKYETEGITQAKYSRHGAIRVLTGEKTGRSQDARYFITGKEFEPYINPNNPFNHFFDGKLFDMVWQDALLHAKKAPNPMFLSHLYIGSNPKHARRLHVYTHYAWHAIFALNMFNEMFDGIDLSHTDEWIIINDPSFLLHKKYGVEEGRGIFIDFQNKRILLAGMHYGGEMKKSPFTMMNTVLPLEGIPTYHCAASAGENGDVIWILGLSGSGKTTHVTDPTRYLIGDDEHFLSEEGTENMEGGCYAKGANVSLETEPGIYRAIYDGAIIENADLDDDNNPILYHPRIENVRISYDRSHIKNRMPGNRGGAPKNIFFLTRDAYSVLPAISRLTDAGALYHYANAYTTEGDGTVMGMEKDPVKHKFSFGYGAAFFPLHYKIYTDLFMEKVIKVHKPKVWLINTGWFGGKQRFPIPVSRKLIHAAINGELDNVPMKHLKALNLDIPEYVPGINPDLLDPEKTHGDKREYYNMREKLIGYYLKNHNAKFSDLPDEIRDAGPHPNSSL